MLLVTQVVLICIFHNLRNLEVLEIRFASRLAVVTCRGPILFRIFNCAAYGHLAGAVLVNFELEFAPTEIDGVFLFEIDRLILDTGVQIEFKILDG